MATYGFKKQNGDQVVSVNGLVLGYFDPKTRPQRSKRFLEIGQAAINWANGVGDPPTEDDIKFVQDELFIEDATAKSRRK